MASPIVTIESGKISGTVITLSHQDAEKVYCYRNIPYASPPIGNLRFMKPQREQSWSGVLDGTTVGKICMQNAQSTHAEEPYFPMKRSPGNDGDMSEDSLHVTVYTPTRGKDNLEKDNLPVLFWIYGGSFQDGSERLYDGSALAGLFNVVVVIPNYRVNVFGFLSLGKSCPGNAGLWDQRMALQWTQKNIAAFGGNPGNVTLFGESAGAMSVHHHLLSTQSQGLFHKAISHSGQATADDFFDFGQNDSTTTLLLAHLGIEDTEEKAVLEKLQALSSEELLAANIAVVEKSGWQHKFLPCVDGEFVQQNPRSALAASPQHIPYMIGVNNSECRGGFAMCFCDNYMNGITEDVFKTSALFPVTDENLQDWKEFYTIDSADETALSKLYGKVTGDRIFVQPAVTAAHRHAEFTNVFFYQACFQLKLFHDSEYGPESGIKPPWCLCDHGEDVYMMLGVPFTPGELRFGGRFSDDEKELSLKCMKYLTNFARTGDPNDGNEAVEVEWPRYNVDREHINLDHDITIGSNFAEREVTYWTDFLQNPSV